MMSEISATNQVSSILHTAVTGQQPVARIKNKPEHVTGNVKLVSDLGKNSQSSVQFDATGQIVPTAKNVRKNSATANFVNLLA
ncbi:hypothetical protein PT277_10120 [Acetobacteraceae bacterium ESL0709]|nr:hypothetical protein [Acetobacteraceae bacterium ESL0697]MDF7679036.1 hypothetical protein [Acetobacteraceae bacterium ESL0709]